VNETRLTRRKAGFAFAWELIHLMVDVCSRSTNPLAMSARLRGFLQQWLISTLAVLVATQLVRGIHYDTWSGLLAATLILGLLNIFVRPLLTLLSLPLLIITLGLFRLIINALLLLLVDRLVEQFHVDSFGAAFFGGVIISIVALLLNTLTGTGDTRIEMRRSKKFPPPDNKGSKTDDGDGPVIDV
jgi:putative membrane protein